MGNQGSTGNIPDYSNEGSFGKAFYRAHHESGPGSSFEYKGKAFTTDCKDGGNYRNQPIEHTYTKNSGLSRQGEFQTNSKTYDARSGAHPFSSIKFGAIPDGSYKVSGTSNTGGITRYVLEPKEDVGGRTNLQIHQKSETTKWDTKGCISVDKQALSNIKIGDTLSVKKK